MKIDDFDTDILIALLELTEASSTALAHRLLNPQSRHETQTADSKIRYRLEKLRKGGLLEKNGVNYSVNCERVCLTPATLKLQEVDAEIPMGAMLVVIPLDGDVKMRQIIFEKSRQKTSD